MQKLAVSADLDAHWVFWEEDSQDSVPPPFTFPRRVLGSSRRGGGCGVEEPGGGSRVPVGLPGGQPSKQSALAERGFLPPGTAQSPSFCLLSPPVLPSLCSTMGWSLKLSQHWMSARGGLDACSGGTQPRHASCPVPSGRRRHCPGLCDFILCRHLSTLGVAQVSPMRASTRLCSFRVTGEDAEAGGLE